MSSAPSANRTFKWPPAQSANRQSRRGTIFSSTSTRKGACWTSSSSVRSSSSKARRVRSRACATWRESGTHAENHRQRRGNRAHDSGRERDGAISRLQPPGRGESSERGRDVRLLGGIQEAQRPAQIRQGHHGPALRALWRTPRRARSRPPAAPVRGLGSTAGFKMMIQDRADIGLDALAGTAFRMMVNGSQTPGLAQVFTTFTTRVPQRFVDVDRVKAKSMNVAMSDVNDTLQIYLGSLYVNDFNRFGRTYQVTAQADASFRLHAEDIGRIKTRNAAGDMLPLGTLVDIRETTGPDKVIRYNMYPAADINGVALPGVSSGQAIALAQRLAAKELPPGMNYEWTDLTFQEILAGNTIAFIFPLCVVLVFLTLAAQYESWSLPLAIILIVPMCLLSAIAGVWLRGMDNNIFTQIGFIVLVGLASKNAILIVEFAKQLEDAGKSITDAAIEAARLRLRPILMTSFAFILGVVPLVLASGAGAEMRRALGTAVFFGMLGVTVFGLFLTPVFYVVIRKLTTRFKSTSQPAAETVLATPHEAH